MDHEAECLVTDEEKAAFKRLFDIYDINEDGHISSSELTIVLNRLGQYPTKEEVDQFIKNTDKNDNGMIEFQEFCSYLCSYRRQVFNELDADKDGYITPHEMQKGFEKFGNYITIEVAHEMVRVADMDQDGRVSYVEFVCAIQDAALNPVP